MNTTQLVLLGTEEQTLRKTVLSVLRKESSEQNELFNHFFGAAAQRRPWPPHSRGF
jgi:hypothetical protein